MIERQSPHYPFYEWVPRPLGVFVLLFMFFPPTFSGGAYLSNVNEMVGSMGVWGEDIQLASFCSSIGMCLFPPFMIRFLSVRRVKHTFIGGFMLLIALNYVCAVTTSVTMLAVACLVTGFVRAILMFNCTFTIAPYLTHTDTLAMFVMKDEPPADVQYMLERKRTFLMPVLYALILIIVQLSNMLTAWCAHFVQWREAYYAVIGLLLIAIMLVVITMPNERCVGKYCIEWALLPDMFLMAIFLCCIMCVGVYGKTLDWFASPSIVVATGGAVIVCGIYLYRDMRRGGNRYFPLKLFAFRNVWISALLFVLAIFFNSSSSLWNTFIKITTEAGNFQLAMFSKWSIVGCVSGLIISIVMIVRKCRFRSIFLVALMFMAAANAYMYYCYQSEGIYEQAYIPMVLNYAGLLMLYSVVAAFGMKALPSRYLETFVFMMILVRNVVAPIIGSSVYANWFYERQQYYVAQLAQNVDKENPIVNLTDKQAVALAKINGNGVYEASKFSATVLSGKVMKQATLVAMKDITGKTTCMILVAIMVVYVLPYRKNETT